MYSHGVGQTERSSLNHNPQASFASSSESFTLSEDPYISQGILLFNEEEKGFKKKSCFQTANF